MNMSSFYKYFCNHALNNLRNGRIFYKMQHQIVHGSGHFNCSSLLSGISNKSMLTAQDLYTYISMVYLTEQQG